MANYSGLWNNEFGQNYSQLTNRTGTDNTQLAKMFANRIYGRGASRAVIRALIGAAVGGTASLTHKRIKSERDLEANVLGGKRTIETFTEVNRATTAADQTKIVAALDLSSKPTYPKDKSGNGGGSKLGW